MQERVYRLLEGIQRGDRLAGTIHTALLALIVGNIVAVIIESIQPLATRYGAELLWFERISVGLFTLEYGLRIWSCTANPKYRSPITGRLKFAITPIALIDLLAFLPFYLPFAVPDLRVIRSMRLLRMLRVLKLGRYSEAFRVLGWVARQKRDELAASFTLMVALVIVASTLMYEVEREAQPEAFSSVPAAMWWAITTLTTVAYGDVLPVTQVGKILGSFIALLGIGMFALPTGILSTGFVEFVQQQKKSATITCPHCVKEILS